ASALPVKSARVLIRYFQIPDELLLCVLRLKLFAAHHPGNPVGNPNTVQNLPKLIGTRLFYQEYYVRRNTPRSLRTFQERAIRHDTRVASSAGVLSALQHALFADVITKYGHDTVVR